MESIPLHLKHPSVTSIRSIISFSPSVHLPFYTGSAPEETPRKFILNSLLFKENSSSLREWDRASNGEDSPELGGRKRRPVEYPVDMFLSFSTPGPSATVQFLSRHLTRQQTCTILHTVDRKKTWMRWLLRPPNSPCD